MMYRDGQACYTGNSRTVRVKLQCGSNNELVRVEEPKTCEYEAVVKTPAVCPVTRQEEASFIPHPSEDQDMIHEDL